MAKKTTRPANRTMPARDNGRTTPKQATPTRNRAPAVPGAGPVRQLPTRVRGAYDGPPSRERGPNNHHFDR
jgi:hypothetical protein